jgi:PAS domain S-box-containing protein
MSDQMAGPYTIIKRIWPSKIRYQLICGVALIHLLLMTFFVFDLVTRQRDFLRQQSLEQTKSLAETLAINCSSWVLASDVVGLKEIVLAVRQYPGLRYAMIITTDGQVLAHTDESHLGQNLIDGKSLSLLNAEPKIQILHADQYILDIAAPIQANTGKVIGWARIGQGQEKISDNLVIISRNGIFYTLLAIAAGSLLAVLLGNRLTSGLNKLLVASNQVRDGRRDVRMQITHNDEIAFLGEGFNKMLDAIVANENLNEFKMTLDQTMDSVFMFLPDTLHFIYVNQGGIQQVGYSAEELLRMTPLDLKPEFTEENFRTMIAPLVDGTKKYLIFETVHLTKTGSHIPVEVFLQYIKPTGAIGRFVAIIHDISQRLLEAREKEKLQSQLLHTQKLESVGQLAAGIAHEINTPTQYIVTNIDFLEESFKEVTTLIAAYQRLLTAEKNQSVTPVLILEIEEVLEATDWEYLAQELPLAITQSQDGLHRISTIVRAMKEFSHPGSKEKTPLSLNDLINTTLTISRNEWKYVAEVETDLSNNLPKIPCLSDEMGQVFLNLLVNAAHAISTQLGENPNGQKGRITISTRHTPDQIEVRFQDTGCGIPEDILSKVFDPFFTTKDVGKGTGQGLAIARDVIVNKHGGTLEVKSEPGQGATFIIRLPIIPG